MTFATNSNIQTLFSVSISAITYMGGVTYAIIGYNVPTESFEALNVGLNTTNHLQQSHRRGSQLYSPHP